MVVSLENNKLLSDEVKLLKDMTAELEKQIDLLEQQKQKQVEQLKISQDTIDNYVKLLATQKKAYEEEIKNSKPSFLKQAGAIGGAIAIGVLIGLLI